MPPLFLFIGFISALLTSIFSAWILWWIAAACLILFFFKESTQPFPFTPLSVAFLVYILMLYIKGIVLNPVYHGEVIFFILFPVLSFIIFSRLNTLIIERFFKGAVFIFALLVGWGLIQHFTGSWYIVPQGNRANAIFYTPNTFASGINLFLLPLITMYLTGISPRLTYRLSLFFFAGLMATQSRGGYLGLILGMLFLALFTFIGHKQLEWSRVRWARLALGLVVVILIFQISPSWSGDTLKAAITEGHTSNRLELYSIAWEAIKVNPISGYGYFNFGYIFHRYKLSPFTESKTLFVHNDYLQIWLEAGLVGLLSLLGLIGVFYLGLWKKHSTIYSLPNSEWILAIGAAMTSLFAHAVVDFPLYIPAFLFLLGAYLGTFNHFLWDTAIPTPKFIFSINPFLQRIGIRPLLVRGIIIFVFLLWLLQPAIAQFAAGKGMEGLKKGDVKYALKKFRLAQRLVPMNAYYYWCEGIILRDQAIELQNRELAMLADSVFAKGAGVDPYYPNDLIERIRLHRDHRALLDNPANYETLLQWIEYVRTWNPHPLLVKVEYARTLAFTGKKAEAIKIAKDLQVKHPESQVLKNLIKDIEKGAY